MMPETVAVNALAAGTLRAINGLVGPRVTKAYELLLNRPDLGDEDVLRDPAVRETLLENGMAEIVPGSPSALRAIEPVLAFEAVILHQQRRTMEQQARISIAQRSAYQLRRQMDREGDAGAPRLVSRPEEILALSNSIARVTTEEYLSINTSRDLLRARSHRLSYAIPGPRNRNVRQRSIYETSYLTDKAGAEAVAESAAAGSEIRTLPSLPIELRISDGYCALLPLSHTEPDTSMYIRSPTLVKGLRDYFNLLWERATPIGGGESELDSEYRDILVLLNQGLKDEAIARRLDLTLRTVRRRIATLQDRLRVSTRFAAGAAAQRRGWLDS